MQNLKTNESGRSMVEMLGVLAIIGVLSVAGVIGYEFAVRKALANKLLNQASMRATDVATQIGSGNLDSLGNDAFDANLGGGVTMSSVVKGADGYTDYDESDEQFTLSMEGVDEELCQQMQSMAGGSRSVVRAVLCDGDKAILTFNKDLSANPVSSDFDGNKEGCEASGRKYCANDTCIPATEKCPTGGSSFNPDGATEDDGSDCSADTKLGTECQVCIKGSYQDSDAKCEPGQICVDGTCTTPATGKGCLKNSDCDTIDPTNCSGGKCFCAYHVEGEIGSYNNTECQTGPKAANGACLVTEDYSTPVSADNEITGTLSTKYMDWYSAKNFCQAVGGSMISLKGSLCTGSGHKWDCAWEKYKGNLSGMCWWTKDLTNGENSCATFIVLTCSGYLKVDYDSRANYLFHALCE